jgi:hypothetical protein
VITGEAVRGQITAIWVRLNPDKTAALEIRRLAQGRQRLPAASGAGSRERYRRCTDGMALASSLRLVAGSGPMSS